MHLAQLQMFRTPSFQCMQWNKSHRCQWHGDISFYIKRFHLWGGTKLYSPPHHLILGSTLSTEFLLKNLRSSHQSSRDASWPKSIALLVWCQHSSAFGLLGYYNRAWGRVEEAEQWMKDKARTRARCKFQTQRQSWRHRCDLCTIFI